jgi:uncharacterized membrane protein
MKKKHIIALLFLPVFCGLTVLIISILYQNGNYPTGSDTFAHLYKGQVLYEHIKDGDFWPLFDPDWYNGVQMMRFWAPLPVYVIAICIEIGRGSIFNGYLLFAGLVFLCGALSWLYIGMKKERTFLCGLLGILWFFIPNNLFALFSEGNLPRSLSMVFLPLLFYNIYEYLFAEDKNVIKSADFGKSCCNNNVRWKNFLGIIVIFSLITLCHSGYAGMVALSILLFLLVARIKRINRHRTRKTVLAVALGYILPGIWLLPSLVGGITSMDSSEVMKGFFQNFFRSVNPIIRLKDPNEYFYIGLSIVIISIFGILVSKKEAKIGFITAFIILICTSNTMYQVIVALPGSQFLWMLRFISIAIALVLYSIVQWKTLKRPYQFIIVGLIVLDIIPSLNFFRVDVPTSPVTRLEETEKADLMDVARKVTTQRIALIDGSTTGSMGEYILTRGTGNEKRVAQVFGAGYQSAATAQNIVLLNKAAECGGYTYLFNRSLIMGADSVLIKIDFLENKSKDLGKLNKEATNMHYTEIAQNHNFILYHLDTKYKNFGTKNTYSGIIIGRNAAAACIYDPDMLEASSENLSDYSYDYLKKFKLVYLASFKYNDQKEAEDLITRLADNGVHVVIIGEGIPADKSTRTAKFLGVTAHNISFENGYPLLYINKKVYDLMLFPKDEAKWSTTYFTGLDEKTGYLYDNNTKIHFMGSSKNSNITFIGLNLPYHYMKTRDNETLSILSDAYGDCLNKSPKTTIVPLSITYDNRTIKITSDDDKVNTGIAYQDNYSSEDTDNNQASNDSTKVNKKDKEKIHEIFNLVEVDRGKTIISLHYPMFVQGLILSLLALAATILFTMREKKNKN